MSSDIPIHEFSFVAMKEIPAQSQSQIIQSKSIGGGLHGFHSPFNSICEDIGIPSSLQVLDQVGNEGIADRSHVSRVTSFSAALSI